MLFPLGKCRGWCCDIFKYVLNFSHLSDSSEGSAELFAPLELSVGLMGFIAPCKAGLGFELNFPFLFMWEVKGASEGLLRPARARSPPPVNCSLISYFAEKLFLFFPLENIVFKNNLSFPSVRVILFSKSISYHFGNPNSVN